MQTRAILRVGFREMEQATLNLPADRSGEAGYVIKTKPSQSFVSPTPHPFPLRSWCSPGVRTRLPYKSALA